MDVSFRYGRDEIALRAPDSSVVYLTDFPPPAAPDAELVLEAVRAPVGAPPLAEALASRREGDVVVVVSDITRPVPYSRFLAELLAEIESAGVSADEILILVATGMHRPSTADERVEMFGEAAASYRIEDHRAEEDSTLAELSGRSWSGSEVRLNRNFVEAGFRIITGLVEPHFMAGFSGGRKAVFPGLASLRAVQQFHGHAFLSDCRASNGVLEGNPLHQEALSVARLAGVDFSLNVVLDSGRRLVRAFAGELEEAHAAAVEFVRAAACPAVMEAADVVVSSCGGYPLDATFYQCVKGFVSCLPAVRPGGGIIAFGSCTEGVGGAGYAEIIRSYSGRWREFLADISRPGVFTKDQWELQMQCRALEKVGVEGLSFVTGGIEADELARLSVNGSFAGPADAAEAVQELLDGAASDGSSVALVPDGPYCTPLA